MKRCYSTLRSSNFNPKRNPISVLDHCKSIHHVKQVQAQLITTGRIHEPVTATKFITSLALSNFDSLSYTRKVFDQITQPDVFLYNTMIKANSQAPSSCAASFLLFRSMIRDSGVYPNSYTLVFVLNACGNGLGVLEGEQVHVRAVRVGLESNLFVSNALSGMYANFGMVAEANRVFDFSVNRDLYSWNIMIKGYVSKGEVDRAKELFDEMPERDVVSWSSVIAGYVQVGCFMKALDLFQQMLQAGVAPNQITLTTVLAACANLVALEQGRWIHVYIEKNNIQLNDHMLASLIDMYAKCGEIDLALEVFNKEHTLKQKVWPWNTIIHGLAMHGRSKEAVQVFEQMKIRNVHPNNITFIALLNACSHGYMVNEGRNYFKAMASSYNIKPELEHYGCIVDLLGRAGFLEEAEDIILSMPMAPDTAIWGALLGACRIHKDIARAEKIGKIIQEFESNHVGCDVLMANLYSTCGRWNEAKLVQEKIRGNDEGKIAGCSLIESNGMYYEERI